MRKIEATARRIAELLPEDDEARGYASIRFAKIGIDLHQVCLYQPARVFLTEARRFDPSNEVLESRLEECERFLGATQEFEVLKADGLLIAPVRQLCSFHMAKVHEEEIYNEDRVYGNILFAMADFRGEEVWGVNQPGAWGLPPFIRAEPRYLRGDYCDFARVRPTADTRAKRRM